MRPDQSLQGIVHILIACVVLSAQDAIIKWLVEDISLFQVLFVRSITIIITRVACGSQLAARIARCTSLIDNRHTIG